MRLPKDAAGTVRRLLTHPSVLSPATGIAVSVILLLFTAQEPLMAIGGFMTGCFTSVYYFGSMLSTAALYMIAGTGAAFAIKSGNLNLGGEGQIYAGGFITAVILTRAAVPAPIALLYALAAALIVPALLASLSAFLRLLKGANVLLTSFLISAAVIPFIDALIAGPFRGSSNNLLATGYIADQLRLPQLMPPSPLSPAVFIALICCLLAARIMFGTTAGRHLQVWGAAPEFARYSGYSVRRAVYIPLAASGALHGLTGFFAITGTYYTCHSGFYSGMGWSALSCALIACSHPAAVIPSGLILAWLNTAANKAVLSQNFSFDITSLIQGTVLFCIAINFIARSRRS